jgi:outer membrane lipoprotein-sorting protein
MRSRAFILTILAVLAAVAVVVGVAVAGTDHPDPLPGVSAPELLAKMAQANGVTTVSGDIAWHNGLFGDLGAAASGMAQLPAQSPLTSSGSGRVWVSPAGARIESQGSGGDQVVIVNQARHTAWIYDYAQNTAKRVVVRGSAPAETPSPAPSAALMTPQAITLSLQQVARFATVEVAGQATVAGRDVYQLRLTPVAKDTAIGYVQAAIDGETMLPLRIEVYARGAASPVLEFGFTRVSYAPIASSRFAFAPPAGAKVTTKTIDVGRLRAGTRQAQKAQAGKAAPTVAQKAAVHRLLQHVLLTRGQVARLVPYKLAYARAYTARPFQWGFVTGRGGPLTAAGAPLAKLLGAATGVRLGAGMGAAHSPGQAGARAAAGPSSVLFYGQGLGTIALAQTKTTPALARQLRQAQSTSQILGTTTVDGVKALKIGTPLGGVIVWQKGGTTLVAGGLVPMSDLEAFATSVR